jgi:pimeloyl-ACP methyl ester carboxylesterase
MRESNGVSGAPGRRREEAGDRGAGRSAGGNGDLGGAGAGLPPRHVAEHTGELRELPVFWRSASDAEANAPALYLHGVPTSSDDWLPFLARSGGLAVDLPGFGRSGKPGYLTYTIPEYEGFIESYLDLVEVERVQLVMHDWGAVGLAFAQRHPERVERLVLINAVPFLPGYEWHRVARIWRTPLLGELAMGASTRSVLRFASRAANATPGPLPDAWLDGVVDHFDQGTQRAILRLYRGASSNVLARAGAGLDALAMPALVMWGARDPYIPVRFAEAYARALPDAELEVLQDAGHWPWLDQPAAIDRVVGFLTAQQ